MLPMQRFDAANGIHDAEDGVDINAVARLWIRVHHLPGQPRLARPRVGVEGIDKLVVADTMQLIRSHRLDRRFHVHLRPRTVRGAGLDDTRHPSTTAG